MKLTLYAKNKAEMERAVKDFDDSLTFEDAYNQLKDMYDNYDKYQKKMKTFPKAVKEQIAEKHIKMKKGKDSISCQQNADSGGVDEHEPVVKMILSK